MLSAVNRHVIARESNIVRVDFSREPDPPTPCFPGANGLRAGDCVHDLGPETNDQAGDGTTTATVLSHGIVKDGAKAVACLE
jgi:hypothetical protein